MLPFRFSVLAIVSALACLTSCQSISSRSQSKVTTDSSIAVKKLATADQDPESTVYQSEVTELVRWYDALSLTERVEACKAAGVMVETDIMGESMQRFTLASSMPTKHMENRHLRSGVGVPVIAWRENDGTRAWDDIRPPEGVYQPATAVLDVLPSGTRRLRILSPVTHDQVTIQGKKYPLAADFTAAYATLIKSGKRLHKSGFKGMIRAATSEREAKLYLMQPYDPNKIPLLITHGLQSSPVAFANLINDLRADPVIRSRYQIWTYYYPTGRPVLVNAANYRRIFKATLKRLDPKGKDFATNHIVVLGHSMGGVISHTLVSDSDWDLWDATIKVRPDRLKSPPETKAALEDVLLFKREPRVRRVIFVAAPHRGSLLAENWIGDIGQWLFKGDDLLLATFKPLLDADQVIPFYATLLKQGKLSSIRTLSSNNPDLRALAERPILIPYHSIIGQKKPGPVLEGSDGVVAYTSSHLAGATSEKVVPYGHSAFRHPEGNAEIRRILHQHLNMR